MDRVSIIGTTGSGKSTLARQLSTALAVPCVDLDAIHWGQGDWTPLPRDRFREVVAEAVQQERWVVEGGYSAVRPLVWARADTVVWLDYSFQITFSRLLRRTARRVAAKELLWGGNRETLSLALSRDSILVWCVKTHWRNRRKFREELARPEYRHLRLQHFQSPRRTEAWLSGLTRAAPMKEEGAVR